VFKSDRVRVAQAEHEVCWMIFLPWWF